MKKNKKGFTIVELLVTATLLVLVLTVGYQFFNYLYNSYQMSEKQWIEEQYVHRTATVIAQVAGTAFEAKILDAMPAVGERSMHYIYGTTATPRYRSVGTNGLLINDLPIVPDEYAMALKFMKSYDDDGNLLKQAADFELTGQTAGYKVMTTVNLANMEDNSQLIGDDGRVFAFKAWMSDFSGTFNAPTISFSSCCGR
jgi:prepilin-type N-terminal cleavage/methylation domain-containing protein